MWKSFLLVFVGVAAWGGATFGQSNATTLSRVLQQYAEVHGQNRIRGVIDSVHLRGVQMQDGQALELTVLKKRPGWIRYQLGTGGGSVILGYGREGGWRQTRSDAGQAVERLGPEATALLRKEAEFSSALLNDLYDPNQSIELEGTEQIADELVYRLTVTEPEGRAVVYYVTVEESLVVKKSELNEDGQTILEHFYRDYREVDGYPFAYEVETRVGGEVVALTRFEEIKVNSGVLSFYFEIPE